MITIGMLHYRKDPNKVFKSYAYAATAKMEGVNFFYFTPGRVDLDKEKIKGLYYENGRWIEKETTYPDVIYNAGGASTEKQSKIHDHLISKVPFTSHPIGNKLYVYNQIYQGKDFSQYLIPSEEVISLPHIYEFIKKNKEIVLKPAVGSKGSNIYFIRQVGHRFEFKQDHNIRLMDKSQLDEELAEILLSDDLYLVQPFINCKTKNDLAYDFRLHVQKNGEGRWVLTTIYPRVASKGSIANIHSGGYTSLFPSFLESQFGDEYYNIKRYLEQFALMFAEHFDSLYSGKLDELGIDVGLDQNSKIWLFEVNWRPGVPVSFYLEMDVVKNMIKYCIYLAQKNKTVGGE